MWIERPVKMFWLVKSIRNWHTEKIMWLYIWNYWKYWRRIRNKTAVSCYSWEDPPPPAPAPPQIDKDKATLDHRNLSTVKWLTHCILTKVTYRQQGNGNFPKKIRGFISIFIKHSHFQNIMNIFNRTETRNTPCIRYKNTKVKSVPRRSENTVSLIKSVCPQSIKVPFN